MYITKQLQKAQQRKQKRSHQSSILKEMNSTIQKLSNLNMSPHFSQKMQIKKELETYINEIIQLGSGAQALKAVKHRRSQMKSKRNSCDLNNINDKNLINRPGVKFLRHSQNINIESQLRQIMYISGNSKSNQKNKLNVKKSRKTLVKNQPQNGEFYNEEKIIKKYWREMEILNKISKKSINVIQQQKIDKEFRSEVLKLYDDQQNEQKYAKLLLNELDKITPNFSTVQSVQSKYPLKRIHFGSISAGTTLHCTPQKSSKKIMNQQNMNIKMKQLNAKQILQNSLLPVLQEGERIKENRLSIPKQVLENENALKIYLMMRGGYNPDPGDVDGEYLSLKKFNLAKEEFLTLNECYLKVRKDPSLLKIDEISPNDSTFKTIVYLCELQGKIAPSELHKLMKNNKIVK